MKWAVASLKFNLEYLNFYIQFRVPFTIFYCNCRMPKLIILNADILYLSADTRGNVPVTDHMASINFQVIFRRALVRVTDITWLLGGSNVVKDLDNLFQ